MYRRSHGTRRHCTTPETVKRWSLMEFLLEKKKFQLKSGGNNIDSKCRPSSSSLYTSNPATVGRCCRERIKKINLFSFALFYPVLVVFFFAPPLRVFLCDGIVLIYEIPYPALFSLFESPRRNIAIIAAGCPLVGRKTILL